MNRQQNQKIGSSDTTRPISINSNNNNNGNNNVNVNVNNLFTNNNLNPEMMAFLQFQGNSNGVPGMASSAPAGFTSYMRGGSDTSLFLNNANQRNQQQHNPTLLPTSEIDPTLLMQYVDGDIALPSSASASVAAAAATATANENNQINAMAGPAFSSLRKQSSSGIMKSSSSILYSDDDSIITPTAAGTLEIGQNKISNVFSSGPGDLTEADLFGGSDFLNPAEMDLNSVDDMISPADLSPYGNSPNINSISSKRTNSNFNPNYKNQGETSTATTFFEMSDDPSSIKPLPNETANQLYLTLNRSKIPNGSNPTNNNGNNLTYLNNTPAMSIRGGVNGSNNTLFHHNHHNPTHNNNQHQHHQISMSLPANMNPIYNVRQQQQNSMAAANRMLPIHPDQIDVKSGTIPIDMQQLEKRRRRRESHNIVERRRRDNINERIQELSLIIPEDPESMATGLKLHKGQILQRAAEYIRYLQEVISLQTQEIKAHRPNYEPPVFQFSITNGGGDRKGSMDLSVGMDVNNNSAASTPSNFNNLNLGD